jgi:hypothetical protein
MAWILVVARVVVVQEGVVSVVPDGHGVVKALRLAVMADDLRIAPVAATVFRHGSVARGRCARKTA